MAMEMDRGAAKDAAAASVEEAEPSNYEPCCQFIWKANTSIGTRWYKVKVPEGLAPGAKFAVKSAENKKIAICEVPADMRDPLLCQNCERGGAPDEFVLHWMHEWKDEYRNNEESCVQANRVKKDNPLNFFKYIILGPLAFYYCLYYNGVGAEGCCESYGGHSRRCEMVEVGQQDERLQVVEAVRWNRQGMAMGSGTSHGEVHMM